MARFRTERAVNKSGWTRWVQPNMDKYMLKCCDCGLVHEMKFEVRKVVSREVDYVVSDETKPGKYIVRFRARRA